MTWRLAKSLETFRDQVNRHSPKRNKASDGTIGDAAHATTNSDHNPWVKDGPTGVVTALDITHDPDNKVDTYKLAEHLRQMRDPRIKYVISNKRIFSSTQQPWTWRVYTGSNPHSKHVHISVNSSKSFYDDAKEWNLFEHVTEPTTPASRPPPKAPVTTRPTLRRGSKGQDVRDLQQLLFVDGDFGTKTETAVKAFQKAHKLTADGVVGPATWAKLEP